MGDIPIQKKYVDIYNGMKENYDAVFRGVEQMHESCEVSMDHLIKTSKKMLYHSS